MVCSSKLILALLLATTALSPAVSQLLPAQVGQVEVLGRLLCSVTGNVVPGVATPGVLGVNVNVECNNGTIDLGTLVTNITGFFDGVLRTVEGVLLQPSNCVAKVTLPFVECTVLPPSGVLLTILGNNGLVDTAVGSVTQLLAKTWMYVAV